MNQESTLQVAPPDVEIRVTTRHSQRVTYLDFEISSQELDSDAAHCKTEIGLGRSPEDYFRDQYDLLQKLHRGFDFSDAPILNEEVHREVEAIGRRLYDDLFPEDLKAFYRTIRHRAKTILIVSDEPWIPWELVKPYDDTEVGDVIDDDFLCMAYILTRWLSGPAMPRDRISVKRAACVHPYTEDMALLTATGAECESLARLAEAEGVEFINAGGPVSHKVLVDLLSKSELDLIHVTAHGEFHSESPDQSRILLADGRSFRPQDIQGPIKTTLARNRPHIFFNVCESARQSWALNRTAGWPMRLIGEARCATFIGSAWTLNDSRASKFASVYYRGIADGHTLGEAMFQARSALRDSEPMGFDWLAYQAYGHPNCRITFGQDESRETERQESGDSVSMQQAVARRAINFNPAVELEKDFSE